MRGTLNSEDVLESRIAMAQIYLVVVVLIYRTAQCMPALKLTDTEMVQFKKNMSFIPNKFVHMEFLVVNKV